MAWVPELISGMITKNFTVASCRIPSFHISSACACDDESGRVHFIHGSVKVSTVSVHEAYRLVS